MSIEKDLTRIAEALEALVGALTQEVVTTHKVKGTPVPTPETNIRPSPIAPEAPVDMLPTDDIPMSDAPQVTAIPVIKTAEELRTLAQGYIINAGDKGQELVTFIKNEICFKFSPKEPKLVKIPADKLQKAAEMLVEKAKMLKIEN